MKRTLRNERGMALAMAIFALVVVGALVAGALFVGTQEQRVGENQRRIGQSFGVAEAALIEESNPVSWNSTVYNSMLPYPRDTARLWPDWPKWKDAPGGTGKYGGYMVRMNDAVYFMDMMGQDRVTQSGALIEGGARQRLGMVMRLRPLNIQTQASLTTMDNVTLQGNAEINGNNQNPGGWDCDAVEDSASRAGIRTKGTVNAGGASVIDGQPPVMTDPSLADTNFTVFGDFTWAELTSRANHVVMPGNITVQPSLNALNQCDRNDRFNWGDGLNKLGACGNYFPIIYIPGAATNTVINGVQGQGILLVDGDLDIQGSFEFFGVVIVQGSLKTTGGGTSVAHFWGAVLAKSANLNDDVKIGGSATLNYSKCAITDALQKTGVVAQMRSRGWSQLF